MVIHSVFWGFRCFFIEGEGVVSCLYFLVLVNLFNHDLVTRASCPDNGVDYLPVVSWLLMESLIAWRIVQKLLDSLAIS